MLPGSSSLSGASSHYRLPMPELPEVETVRRDIVTVLVGRCIRRVSVLDPRLVRPASPAAFENGLTGACVSGVERRGKYLLLSLGDRWLALHLMMSGRVYLRDACRPERHTRLVIGFDAGPHLHFVDTRRFGRAWLADDAGLVELLAGLGPEPLAPGFDWRSLRRGFAGRSVAVKSALLDQRTVAGVGNIYADESLWTARIHPATPAGELSARRLKALAAAIVRALQEGIDHGGTSFRTFENSQGKPGLHQQELNVFRRTGQPCPRCGRPIRKIILGQRSTHYCAYCQRPNPARA